MLLLTVATLLAGPHPRPVLPARRASEVTVTVDSARHTLTIAAGPFALPAAQPTTGPMDHHAMHQGSEVPMMLFKWPVAGWTRGFELRLTDGQGRPLNRRLLHHLNVVNFGRRQLFYAIPERMLAVGQETPDVILPKTVGIPVEAGMPMGLIVAWHNEKPEPVPEIHVTLVMHWSPTNLAPRPTSVLPVYFDVQNPVGKSVAFDLPAGRSTFHADLTLPAGGRIVGIGGHGHDFMTDLALEEVNGSRARTVTRLRTPLDSSGRLISVEQKLPGIRGNGIPLRRGATYRITGSYDNTTGAMIPDGAMIHIILLYAVDDLRQWPALDADDPDWRTDLDYLDAMNTGGGDGDGHGEHQH